MIAAMLLISSVQAELIYSSKVKQSYKKIINNDLEILKKIEFKKESDPAILTILNIDILDSSSLTEWLESRVHYVIHDQVFEKLKIFQAQRSWDYQNQNIFPTIETSLLSASGKGVTVMSNIGTAIYHIGKKSGALLGINITKSLFTSEKVKMTSPRKGVIQIGEGLFMRRLQINRSDPNRPANTFGRLATLLHEARHSDGNGKSLGFFHAICPKGHDYEGLKACDRNLNGPYTVGASLLKEFAKNCDSCDEYESERLRLKYLDSISRVIKETEVLATIEDLEVSALALRIKVQENLLSAANTVKNRQEIMKELKKLKAELLQLMQLIGQSSTVKSRFLNSDPEGL
jgi:hypothetical protein